MVECLELIPLGGLGEFGMNCAALRCNGDMVLIDAGMTLPGRHLGTSLGVDLIVPDITFLKEHRDQLRAIVLTHGHEDHSGGVAYIINELSVPIYGSRLALGLMSSRLKERKLESKADLHVLEARKPLDLGAFTIEALHATHSFPENFSLGIKTPVGSVIWTGDFKFDQTPIDRKLSDLARLSEYGNEGVLALFSDSTNSDMPGLSPSEFSVIGPLRTLFHEARRRVVLSCFASSFHRMQIVFDLAKEFDRKVFPMGRSMTSNIKQASRLGYLRVPEEQIATAEDLRQLPPERTVLLATGSQGEPMSALSRLAVNEFSQVQVEKGDVVILSARIIPGNEKLITSLVDHFYRREATIFDSRHSNVHVSGHGFREDLKLMINLTRPKHFVPIHGEYRQLKNHALLAFDQGIPQENIHIVENGEILGLAPSGAKLLDKIPVGRRFIDEGILEAVHEVVLRDRRYLSADGVLVVVLRMDGMSGELIGEPDLISRGFVLMEDSEELMGLTRQRIVSLLAETALEEKRDEDLFREILHKGLRRFLRKQTGKRPLILPVTIKI